MEHPQKKATDIATDYLLLQCYPFIMSTNDSIFPLLLLLLLLLIIIICSYDVECSEYCYANNSDVGRQNLQTELRFVLLF